MRVCILLRMHGYFVLARKFDHGFTLIRMKMASGQKHSIGNLPGSILYASRIRRGRLGGLRPRVFVGCGLLFAGPLFPSSFVPFGTMFGQCLRAFIQ